MHNHQPPALKLQTLVDLFFASEGELGQFTEISADAMPEAYRRLLAHENHMTVTVEAHHKSPVDVVVLDRRKTPSHYARKIVLCRQSDHEVVQFGIMRVNYSHLAPAVRQAIESEDTPLGRILIDNNVYREIQLASLFRISPGKELKHFFGLDSDGGSGANTTYGRTAVIYCDGELAVELLEIVVPE
ncbi:MAG: hypothetical protein K1X71_04415 [Pirellulales bacterium]|nr:hypothetical protein [Pirellulales bacterium]